MNPVSRSIRDLAARLCYGGTLERLIDPILADIELEYREQIQAGRVWRARWLVVAGYSGLAHAMVLHAIRVSAGALVLDESVKRTVWFSLAAFVVLIIALMLPPLLDTHIDGILAIYLVPQAIPLSLPFALSVGIGCGWSKGTTGRDMFRRVAVLVVAGGIIAAGTMEWLIPAAHQGFKATVITRFEQSGRSGSVTMPRGISERSLSELAALIRHTTQTRPYVASEYEKVLADLQEVNAGMPRGRQVTANELQLAFHVRLALCFATAALGFLAVATASAFRRRSLAATAFVVLAVLYVYAWFGVQAIGNAVPPAVSAWTPNAAAAAMCLILLSIGLLRKTPTALLHE